MSKCFNFELKRGLLKYLVTCAFFMKGFRSETRETLLRLLARGNLSGPIPGQADGKFRSLDLRADG